MAAVLVIAYRRHENVVRILNDCVRAGIQKIYISVDGAANSEAEADVALTVRAIQEAQATHKATIEMRVHNVNVGCAVSLISACDQILLQTSELIILEDDCLPCDDFWIYSSKAFDVMKKNHSIGLFCGTNFVPQETFQSSWFTSKYPLHWGWGITSDRWFEIRKYLASDLELTSKNNCKSISRIEAHYWNTGCRRALSGQTDVWDTLFVREMLRLNLRALLPPENLVSNIGNDEHALHTDIRNEWTRYRLGMFSPQVREPILGTHSDVWLKEKYFKISKRHVFTTRLSWIRRLFQKPKFAESLERRLADNQSTFA